MSVATDYRWLEDKHTFKYKISYYLEMPALKLVIIYDTKSKHVVSGSLTLKKEEYVEIDVAKLSVAQAKRRMMWAAINIGSSLLIRKTETESQKVFLDTLVDNLEELYTMIIQNVKDEKEKFKKEFLQK